MGRIEHNVHELVIDNFSVFKHDSYTAWTFSIPTFHYVLVRRSYILMYCLQIDFICELCVVFVVQCVSS